MKALRIIFIVIVWFLVLGTSAIPANNKTIKSFIEDSAWLSTGTFIQLTILASSFVLILIFSRGNLTRYGIRKASWKDIKTSLVIGSISAVTVHLILLIIQNILPPSGSHPVFEDSSFVHIVLSTWILASISEEMLHRGLIQSFLDPLKKHGVSLYRVYLSIPVLISAFLFGIMHVMLLTMGMNVYRVACIVCSAIVLGVVAGFFREKSSSVLPAMLIHMLFNVYGTAADYIQQMFTG
jgi:membrane protease YdiL (CAAX protease family)